MTTVVVYSNFRPKLLENTRTSRWCFLCGSSVPAGEPVMQITRSNHAHVPCWEKHEEECAQRQKSLARGVEDITADPEAMAAVQVLKRYPLEHVECFLRKHGIGGGL